MSVGKLKFSYEVFCLFVWGLYMYMHTYIVGFCQIFQSIWNIKHAILQTCLQMLLRMAGFAFMCPGRVHLFLSSTRERYHVYITEQIQSIWTAISIMIWGRLSGNFFTPHCNYQYSITVHCTIHLLLCSSSSWELAQIYHSCVFGHQKSEST